MRDTPQVKAFIDKYTPQVAAQLRAARKDMRTLVPNGFELVYDNYNALVFGFGPTQRASDAVLSLAAYPKYVTLFFLRGVTLDDPKKLLQGNGKTVRSIRLQAPDLLRAPGIAALVRQAVARDAEAFAAASPLRMIVRSISASQRPRKP